MVDEFKFPDVGEGITEGKLVHWKVAVGDSIKVDQIVADVETDKAIVEIPSPFSGSVTELLFSEGDMLEVGKVIMKVDSSGGDSPKVEEEKAPEAKTEEVVEEKPQVQEEKVEEVEPKVEEAKEEPKVEVLEEPQTEDVKDYETSKEPEVESKSDVGSSKVLAMPAVRKEAREKGIDLSTVTPSGNSGQITMEDLGSGKKVEKVESSEIKTEPKVAKSEPTEVSKVSVASKDVIATPSIRKKARELGIDINTIKGSGEDGRILEGDLVKSDSKVSDDKSSDTKTGEVVDSKVPSTSGDRIPLSGIRGIISKRMVESLQKSAQVTFCDEANVSELVELRNREKEKLKEKGIKLTYLPFFIKAFIAVAKKYPSFNAHVDDEKNEIVLSSEFNVGIAADTEKGLVVPVVKNSDRKSIVQLAKELLELGELAKASKLSAEQMSGSTFTISSVGSLGGQFFTPILNYPEVAILGIGKIMKKPVVIEDEIKIAHICSFSLTFDHRAVDGADAARFMKEFIALVEDPELLFLEGL